MAFQKTIPVTLVVVGSLVATPTLALDIVFDPRNMAESIKQVSNQVEQIEQLKSQLDEAKRLYDSVNDFKDVEDIAKLLDSNQIRRYLPENFDDYEDLLTGKGSGDLASRIASIRAGNKVTGYTATDDFYGKALERQGMRTARGQGIGEVIYETAEDRLGGLKELRDSIDRADNVGELTAISTRLQAEQAMLQNDLMRMQGLKMVQEAEERTGRQTLMEDRRRQDAEDKKVIESWITR
ncbi:type IV secretion system protein [Aureimonas sp. N4]|uniref:type IV secretion system protein n=1 Tax=Aureimonas sp. N4 TaxID=1638165 RepID=UPI0007867356|nr:type IV secretion system protein [Aureimonas sp. N4]